ncbi:MAG: glucose 1-dehydrogenase [Oscillospiraceae bacterium]|nr:glucose 1-dehydrogenase [Oscillospiraceae bacterium]
MNSNKTAVITGGSGGIGSAAVKLFGNNGYNVAFSYNSNAEGAQSLVDELHAKVKIISIKADFTKQNEVYIFTEKVFSEFENIDTLVNIAGISHFDLVQFTSDEKWDEVFDINIKAPFILTKAFLPGMINRKSGTIVNVSSMWGITGASCESAYSASKSALIGFTKACAKELAPSMIRVNCVCPGVINTKMNDRFSDTEKSEIAYNIPMERFGSPDEIAEAILFLASERSSYITGQILSADGGYTI